MGTNKQSDRKYLYRGVNADLYRSTGGRLTPKSPGQKFERPIYWGGEIYFSDGSVYGSSERNAVIMHQCDSTKNPTSGVSTTPNYEHAVRYATHNGKSGYVYKIDSALLDAHGVKALPVDHHAVRPAIPDDHEVILVADDFGTLPDQIIVEIVEIAAPR
jgi:hypothetical protein